MVVVDLNFRMRCLYFSLSRLYYVQTTEDHAGGCHSFYLYQHAFQSHGSQHPTRHQGTPGTHAGCWPQVHCNDSAVLIIYVVAVFEKKCFFVIS